MQPERIPTSKDHLARMIADMAEAVSRRDGESEAREQERFRLAARMIVDLGPRDMIETMMAGHCVMLHELMVDNFRMAVGGGGDTARRWTRISVSLDAAFGRKLTQLERFKQRPVAGIEMTSEDIARPVAARPAAAPVAVAAVPPAVRPAVRDERRAARPAAAAMTAPDSALPRSRIDAVKANPAAIAAIKAGDPLGFARALGVADPDPGFLAAAATPGGPFDSLVKFTGESGPWAGWLGR